MAAFLARSPFAGPTPTERWWDQIVHYPPPPPSCLPRPPAEIIARDNQCSRPPPTGPHWHLIDALQNDTGEIIVLSYLGLRDAIVLSLVSRGCHASILSILSQATYFFAFAPRDTTFAAAALVARRMPMLRRLVVHGVVDISIDISSFRDLAASGRPILIGHLNKECALFIGAVLASYECTFVTSDSRRIALPALRDATCVRLRGVRGSIGLGDTDLAALLGALSLNRGLHELDLCANPAPCSAWIVQQLSASLHHERLVIRHHRILDLAGVCRAAPSFESSLLRGVALPGWLAPHASSGASATGEANSTHYCLPVPAWVAGSSSWLPNEQQPEARLAVLAQRAAGAL